MPEQKFSIWCSHDRIRKGQWWRFATGLGQAEANEQAAYRTARVKPECRFKVLPAGETP